MLELFFDLVFVFAITQVSHLLLENLTWEGAGHAALALLVVWWAWNYTTWVTNELDPDSVVVRLLLIALMLGSLLMGAQRHEEAERNLRVAVQLAPQSVRANYQLGLLLARMGRKEEADRQLAHAKTLREEDEASSRLQLRLMDPDQ